VQVAQREGGSDVFAEKGRSSRYGVWLVHLSLLVILGGGIVGRLTAFEGTALVPQNGGEVQSFNLRTPDGSTPRKRLGFTLRCTDFRLRLFENGAPKAYESDLVALDDQGNELKRATINVNHPLRIRGLTIFQSSYQPLEDGARARLRLLDRQSGEAADLLLSPGEKIEAADGLTYTVVDTSEDFANLGEAVQVLREEEGKRPSRFWVFAKAPQGFDARNRADRFSLSFSGTAQLYATGLQIARDPSTPIVYLGCFFLFLGCGIAFYTSHKRIWARVTGSGVELGGAAHRNADAFRLELESICAAVGLDAAGPAHALAA
jgi:cytochrome c biogenesis protein